MDKFAIGLFTGIVVGLGGLWVAAAYNPGATKRYLSSVIQTGVRNKVRTGLAEPWRSAMSSALLPTLTGHTADYFIGEAADTAADIVLDAARIPRGGRAPAITTADARPLA